MSTIAGVRGHQPGVTIGKANPEAAKYRQLWKRQEYRRVSLGEQTVLYMLEHMSLTASSHLIDFGCGTGRGGALVHKTTQCQVTLLDFVGHCLDDTVKASLAEQSGRITFQQVDLEEPIAIKAAFGLCADVMEHIPPQAVEKVLNHILMAANHVWFQISTTDDQMGALIGEPLHVSVHPHAWWRAHFTKRECVIHHEQEHAGVSIFYVSAWSSAADVQAHGKVNLDHAVKREQMTYNVAQGWNTIHPHEVQGEAEVMLVGGGWSLPAQLDTIRALRARGVKLVTLNNAYNWCLAQGLSPSATIVMDGREFNKRFTKPVVADCKYLVCSQVHPATFEGLPKDRTYIWHDADKETFDILNAQYGDGNYFCVPGGSTVFLRSIPLLRMLGFQKFHVFGVDSCCEPTTKAHHAYAQAENDHKWILPVTVNNGRVFYCQPWMICQANEFQELIKVLGELFELELYGDGMLKHMLDTAAAQ